MKNFEFIKSALGDNYVQKFHYDIFEKKIELYYNGYYDINSNKYKEVDCVFTIKDWEASYSVPYSTNNELSKKYELDKHMGIFFMIMKIDVEFNFFKITINTIDERYVTYCFESPQLSIVELTA